MQFGKEEIRVFQVELNPVIFFHISWSLQSVDDLMVNNIVILDNLVHKGLVIVSGGRRANVSQGFAIGILFGGCHYLFDLLL